MVARPAPEPGQVLHPLNVVIQAAQVGGAAAVPGTVIGAFAGTLRTTTPILFSIVSGLQWFAIGSTFWTVRSTILNQVGLRNWWNITRGAPLLPHPNQPPSHSEKVRASTISGGITGAVLGALFRGPRNVIPGTIMFTLFGFSGQHAYDWLDRRNTNSLREEAAMKEEGRVKENWLQKLAKKNWSPMSVLTDEEYEKMMNEKILSVEAEIAIIDERIEQFRKQQKELEKKQVHNEADNQQKR